MIRCITYLDVCQGVKRHLVLYENINNFVDVTMETIQSRDKAVLDKITSIRINSQNLSRLRNEAEKDGITLNQLLNQIIADYLKWDLTATKAGWIVVLSDVLRRLFNELDDETLYKIAIITADTAKDARLVMTGDDTIDGFFSILRSRLRKSGISYMESSEKGMRRFIIHHSMGKKWSYFYKIQHERMLHNLGCQAKLDFTENTLVICVKG